LFNLILPAILLLAPLPVFAQEHIILGTTSDQDTFAVEMKWIPADIGAENTFEIRFIEQETRKEVEDIIYDFRIEQEGKEILVRADQTSNIQSITFDEPGSYTIFVNDIDELREGVSFSVQVTPELLPAWSMAGAFAVLFAIRKRLTR
jgi:hypothetical protein